MSETESRAAYKILLVDDNEINQEVLKINLRRFGFSDISLAKNGLEAVELAEREQFDLILMDCQMPIMDGYEATKKIRQLNDEQKSHVPIIAVTAYVNEDEKKKGVDCGMNDYVPKPVNITLLHEKIRAFLPASS